MSGTALIGLGEIGLHAHLPAIIRGNRLELVAVADADPDKRDRARAVLAPGVDIRESLDEVLEDDRVSSVVLATPPWVTPELAIRAVRAGRHVLAEKPVATSSSAAEIYDVLTARERSMIQVGLTYRHDPAMVELRHVVARRVLGDRLLVRAHIYDEQRTSDERHTELIERTLQHGAPVIHEGAHVFDWLSHLLEAEPTITDAWSVRSRDGLGAPNLVGGRLQYGEHVVLVEFGWLVDSLPTAHLELIGDRGRAALDLHSFELSITTAEGTRAITPVGDRMERCFDLQLARFADLVSGRREAPEPDLGDGIRALNLSQELAERSTVLDQVGVGA